MTSALTFTLANVAVIILASVLSSVLLTAVLQPILLQWAQTRDIREAASLQAPARIDQVERQRLVRLATEDPAAYLAAYQCRHAYTLHVLNRDPQIFLIENFLQPGEAEYMRQIAAPLLQPSTVADGSEYYAKSNTRTSSSAYLEPQHDAVVACVEQRAVSLASVSLSSCEPLQVVSYTKDQEFKPHYDWFDAEHLTDHWAKKAGQRYVTILPYLQVEDLEGGETDFPQLNITIPPHKDAAIMWYNLHFDGREDHRTLHAGRPVVAGQKTAVNIWMRQFTPHISVKPPVVT